MRCLQDIWSPACAAQNVYGQSFEIIRFWMVRRWAGISQMFSEFLPGVKFVFPTAAEVRTATIAVSALCCSISR